MLLSSWIQGLLGTRSRRPRKPQTRRRNDYVQLYVTRLEDRRVLNADFALVAGASLTLDNFTQTGDENLQIADAGANYQFTLTEGLWSGADGGGVTGAGTNTLTVAKATADALTTGIIVSDNANSGAGINFDVNFGNANFSGLAGALDFNSVGPVTQDANTTLQVSTLDVDATSVDLNEATNDFGTVRASSGGNVSLVDVSGIILGDSTIGGTLTVTAGGGITDSGALSVAGLATFSAGAANDVTLDSAANDFGTIRIGSAANATVVDADDVDLGASTISGNLAVTAGGDITDSGNVDVDGAATFSTAATADVVLDNAGNDFTGAVSVTQANDVTLRDGNTLTVGNITASGGGAIALQSGAGDILRGAGGTLDTTGLVSLLSTGGSVGATGAGNAITLTSAVTQLSISARQNVFVDAGGATLGLNVAVNPTGGAFTYQIGNVANIPTLTLTDATSDLEVTQVNVTGGANLAITALGGDLNVVDLDTAGQSVNLTATVGGVNLAAGAIDVDGGAATIGGSFITQQAPGTAITADTVVLNSVGGIGGAGAFIEIANGGAGPRVKLQASNTTAGGIFVQGNGGLEIAGSGVTNTSVVPGSIIRASSPLVVNAAVSMAADFTLEAAGSGVDDDDLTINANVTHTGAAGAAKTITLRAGDDILHTGGAISFTNPNAADTVIMNADTEGVGTDTDRGGITQSAGASLTASQLVQRAFENVAYTAGTNDVVRLAASVGSGGFAYTDQNAIEVGTVDGAVGILSAGDVAVTGTTITLAANINSDGTAANGVGDVLPLPTAGSVILTGNVVLAANIVVDAEAATTDGDITFNGSVNATTAGGQGLTLETGLGTVTLGAIGTPVALSSLNVASNGTIRLGGNISTEGNVEIGSGSNQTVLQADVAIDSDSADDGGVGNVTLRGTLSADAAGRTLQILANTGAAAQNGGDVALAAFGNGGGAFLGSLQVNTTAGAGGTAGTATLNNDVLVDGGLVEFQGRVSIPGGGLRTIDTEQGGDGASGDIDLQNAAIAGTGANADLTLNTATTGGAAGNVTLGSLEPFGGSTRVRDLSVQADGTTDGNVSITDPLQAGGSIVIQNANLVDIDADVIAGAVLSVQAASVDLAGNVDLTASAGQLNINAPVVLSGANGTTNVLSANGGSTLTLGGNVTAVNSPSLTLTSQGSVSAQGIDIGATGTLLVTVDSDNNGVNAGSFAGNLRAGQVLIGAAGTNDSFTFNGTVAAESQNIVISGASTASFAGDVTAATSVEISSIVTELELGLNVDVTAQSGSVDLRTGVTAIDLSGNGGTNVITAGPSAANDVVSLGPVAASGATPADLTISAEDAQLASIDVGTSTVTIQQNSTTARAIELGNATAVSPTVLALSAAEIANVTAGRLVIGRADNPGDIRFTNAVATSASVTAGVLELRTGGAVVDNNATGADLTAGNVLIRAAGAVGANNATRLETDIDALEIVLTAAGGVFIDNTGDLSVGGVDGTATGITTTNGDVVIFATGTIIVAEDLTANSNVVLQSLTGITVASNDVIQANNDGFVVLQVTGDDATTAGYTGLRISGDVNAAGSGAIHLISDQIVIDPVASVDAGSSSVFLNVDGTTDADDDIDIGGADAADVLGLTEAELEQLTATFGVLIGRSTTAADAADGTIDAINTFAGGDVTVSADVNLSEDAGFGSIDLYSPGAITVPGSLNETTFIRLEAAGTVTDDGANDTLVDLTTGTLNVSASASIGVSAANALNTSAGNLNLTSQGDIFISSEINTIVGLITTSAGSQTVRIEAANVATDPTLTLTGGYNNTAGDNFVLLADGGATIQSAALSVNALDIETQAGAVSVTAAVTATQGIEIDTLGGGLSVTANVSVGTLLDIDLGAGNGTISGDVSGTGGLTKRGSGTLTLTGSNNTYAGATTIDVNGGTLRVDNPGAINGAGGAVTVNSGGTLGGTGTIDRDVNILAGGNLAPGTSPGILATGNLNFGPGADYEVEIADDNAAGAIAGDDYDQTAVTGTVTIDVTATLTIADLGSPQIQAGDQYVIISNDSGDAVVGNFAGLAEGAVISTNFLGSTLTARITYAGGDGNDVVIMVDGPLIVPAGGTDDYLIRRSGPGGTNIQVIDDVNGNQVFDGGDIILATSNILGTTQIVINANADGDANSLTIDTTNFGNDFRGQILFNGDVDTDGGGADVDDADTLALTGTQTFGTVSYAFAASTITLDADGGPMLGNPPFTVTYTDLDNPIQQNLAVASLTFNYTNGADVVAVTDYLGGGVKDPDDAANPTGAGETQIAATGQPTVVFDNPGALLTVNTFAEVNPNLDVADTVVVTSVDAAYRAALTIDGGAGAGDAIDIDTDLTLGSATSNGNLTLTAETVRLGNAADLTLRTDGGAGTTSGAVVVSNGLASADVIVRRTTTVITNGGLIDLERTTVSASALARDLTLNASTAGATGGDVRLGTFNNVAGGQYLTNLNTLHAGAATNGSLVLNGDVLLDGSGADTGDFTVSDAARVVLSDNTAANPLVIDTEQGDDFDGGAVNFAATVGASAPAALTADAAGQGVQIVTSTALAAATAGAITLGNVDDTGGAFLNDVTLAAVAANLGLITLRGASIQTDDDGLGGAGDVSISGRVQLDQSTTIDTAQGTGPGGVVDLSAASVFANSINAGSEDLTINTVTTDGSAAGNVTLGVFNDDAGAADFLRDVNITSTSAGVAGALLLTAAVAVDGSFAFEGGDATLQAGSSLATNGAGDVTLESTSGANRNILLQAPITTVGGDVVLIATGTITSDANGDITTTAAANSGLASGNVTIHTTGLIASTISLAGTVDTRGAGSAVFNASDGGQVDITTANAGISVADVFTSGGNSNAVIGNGGNAGAINVLAGGNGPTSTVTLDTTLTALGGTAIAGTNGADGIVALRAGGNIVDNNAIEAVNVLAGSLAIVNAAGVGAGAGIDDVLEIQVANLAAAVNPAGIDIENTGNLTITTVTTVATVPVAGLTQVPATAVVGVALTGNPAADIDILTTGTLDVLQDVTNNTGGDIFLKSTAAMTVSATVSASGAATADVVLTGLGITLGTANQSEVLATGTAILDAGVGTLTMAADTLVDADADVIVSADAIDLAGRVVAGDEAILAPDTAAVVIELGQGAVNGFALTDLELNTIEAPIVRIGVDAGEQNQNGASVIDPGQTDPARPYASPTTGAITFVGDFTADVAFATQTFALRTEASVTQTDGAIDLATNGADPDNLNRNLAVRTGSLAAANDTATIDLSGDADDLNNFNGVAATTGGQSNPLLTDAAPQVTNSSITIVEGVDGFSVEAVDGLVGIWTGDRTVILAALSEALGNIAINRQIRTFGGDVDIDAGNNVTSAAAGTITTTAVVDSGLASGNVLIDAAVGGAGNDGAITLAGAIDTSGADNNAGAGSVGGDVILATNNAGGAISVAAITTDGGDATAAGNGGDAGFLSITAGSGDVTFGGAVSVSGGDAQVNGTGGDGGDDGTDLAVRALALAGSVVVNASITSLGGAGTVAPGVGRDLVLTAQGGGSDVVLNAALLTNGGDVDIDAGNDVRSTLAGTVTTTAVAGSGVASGRVTVNAAVGNAASVGLIDLQGAIDTTGATNAGGTGSTGGDVDLTTENTGGAVTVRSVTTTGGQGNAGGNAGGVDIVATGAVTQTTITAVGGQGTATTGGIGGLVTIASTGGPINLTDITTDGGVGATAGGAANTLRVTTAGAGNNITLNGVLQALGGTGPIIGADGIVSLVTPAGSIVDASEAQTNLVAGAARLVAGTGIAGTAGADLVLEVDVTRLAAETATGAIVIADLDTTGRAALAGLTIDTVNDGVGNTIGVRVTSAAGDRIDLSSVATLTVNQQVRNDGTNAGTGGTNPAAYIRLSGNAPGAATNGITLAGAAAVVTTGAGDIVLDANAGNFNQAVGSVVDAGTLVNTARVFVSSTAISLAGLISGAEVYLAPDSGTTPVELGTGATNGFALTDAELNTIEALRVQIGIDNTTLNRNLVSVIDATQTDPERPYAAVTSSVITVVGDFTADAGFATNEFELRTTTDVVINADVELAANNPGRDFDVIAGRDIIHVSTAVQSAFVVTGSDFIDPLRQGDVTYTAARSITLASDPANPNSAGITTLNGDITLLGNANFATPGTFTGITLRDADVVSGNVLNPGGNIVFQGSGGSTGDGNDGVAILNGSSVISSSTGAQNIAITGVARGDSDNDGVVVDLSTVISVSGPVIINGVSEGTGDFNDGIEIANSAFVGGAAGGTGSVTLTGTGGIGRQENRGVYIHDLASVASDFGPVTITGLGRSDGSAGSSLNDGVAILSQAQVFTNGAAGVGIIGNAGAGESSNRGIAVADSLVATGAGPLELTGTSAGFGQDNDGVSIDQLSVVSTVTGSVSIVGTGNGSGESEGVVIAGFSQVVAVAGDVQIGGRSDAAGVGNEGVAVVGGSFVAEQSTGSVTIVGTDGNGTGDVNVLLDGAATAVASTEGEVTIVGTNTDVVMSNAAQVQTDAGIISIGALGSVKLGIVDLNFDGVGPAGTAVITATNGRIEDNLAGDGAGATNVRGPGSVTFNAANGVGRSPADTVDAIDTAVAVLLANGGFGGVYVDNFEALTLAGATTIAQDIVVTATGSLSVVGNVLNTGPGGIALTSGGAMTVNSDVSALGSRALVFTTFGIPADDSIGTVDLVSGGTMSVNSQIFGLGDVTLTAVGGSMTLAGPVRSVDADVLLTTTGNLSILNSAADIDVSGNTVTGIAGGQVLTGNGADLPTIVSSTGVVTDVAPQVLIQATPQISATGLATLTFLIGSPGETNLSFVIDWNDPDPSQRFATTLGARTDDVFRGLAAGTYVVTHQYTGSPNSNAALPIQIRVIAVNDPNINFFGSNTAFELNTEQLNELELNLPGTFANNSLSVATADGEFTTPGTGFGNFFPPIRSENVVIAVGNSGGVQFVDDADDERTEQTDDSDVDTRAADSDINERAILVLRRVRPDGKSDPDEEIELPGEDVGRILQDLPLYLRDLPDGLYELLLIEAGQGRDEANPRIINRFMLRGGKPSGGDYTPPSQKFDSSSLSTKPDQPLSAESIDQLWERWAAPAGGGVDAEAVPAEQDGRTGAVAPGEAEDDVAASEVDAVWSAAGVAGFALHGALRRARGTRAVRSSDIDRAMETLAAGPRNRWTRRRRIG